MVSGPSRTRVGLAMRAAGLGQPKSSVADLTTVLPVREPVPAEG